MFPKMNDTDCYSVESHELYVRIVAFLVVSRAVCLSCILARMISIHKNQMRMIVNVSNNIFQQEKFGTGDTIVV